MHIVHQSTSYRGMEMTPVRLRLAELRKAKGWSIDRLANEAGVNRSTVIRLEQQQTTRVDFDVLDKLAAALECDPGYLIVRTKGGRQ